MFAMLERDADGLKSISLRVPASNKAPVNFTLDRGTGGQPQLRSTVTFDPKTAEITRTESFADQNAGRRARSWMRFVHTGEYYGLIGQGIAGLASLAGVVLSWTGLSLAWNRFALWLRSKRERRSAAGQPRPQQFLPAIEAAAERAEGPAKLFRGLVLGLLLEKTRDDCRAAF